MTMRGIERMIACGAIVVAMTACLARAQSPELLALPKPETYLPKIKAELERMDAAAAQGPYKPDLESFKQHKVPQWLQDAKFGLWYSCSPMSVATELVSRNEVPFADWWCAYMYRPGSKVFEAHRRLFGDQHTFGCKDLFTKFKMERFDPEEFASLCADAGAKFGGPTGAWVDNFFFWDSAVHRWNAKLLGPKRDIVADLYNALTKRGIKKFVYLGIELSWGYFGDAHKFDAADPQWNDLYYRSDKLPVDQDFINHNLASVNEFNRKYSPDLIYFDLECLGQRIGRQNMLRHMAAFYNMAAAQGKEVDVLNKQYELWPYFGVLENESHKLYRKASFPWTMTFPINGNWWWQKDPVYWNAFIIVRNLVDIVSKNGILNLTVPVRSDGTIPDEAKRFLRQTGEWLKTNGEAIYGTRPWRVAEEAASVKASDYADIHFTHKADAVYVIASSWPTKPLTIKSLAAGASLCPEEITGVALLGQGPVTWNRSADGLVIQPPTRKTGDYAWVFKVTLAGRSCADPTLTVADDKGNFTAAVSVNNYSNLAWSPKVRLLVDGQAYATQSPEVAPNQNQVLTFTGRFSGPGMHTIEFAADQFRSGTVPAQLPRIPLAGEWKFRYGDDKGYSAAALDDADWQTVKLPGPTWDKQFGIKPATEPNNVGWYRRNLRLPAEAKGHGLRLTLGHINREGELFFNGHSVGKSEWSSWAYPQEFDVPGEWVNAGDNTLALRVNAGWFGLVEGGGIIANMGYVAYLDK